MKYRLTAALCALVLLLGILTSCASAPQQPEADIPSPTDEVVKEFYIEDDFREDNTVPPELEGYNLIWHDEFSGEELDSTIWNYETRKPRWTNNELQAYTASSQNIFLRDGKLVLKAIKTVNEHGSVGYTSGKLNTQNKQDLMYGKIVIRARVPEGQGLWPAIWMMPTKQSHYGSWPQCGEIDIMEILGSDPALVYSTIHYGMPHEQQQGTLRLENGETFSNSYHEYILEWEPAEMRFYIDDTLTLKVTDWYSAPQGSEDRPFPAPFDQNFYLQLNLAVGGTWPGEPDETTDFEHAEFIIDYVRVYQKPEYDTNVTKPAPEMREPTADGNLVYNGDFAEAENLNDDENWCFYNLEGGKAEAKIENNTMIITTEDAGRVDYSVQLVQADLPLVKGSTYRVTFDASSSESREMIACVSGPNANYIRYLSDTKVALTTDWQTYTYEFTMNEKTDNNGRIEFNMGNAGSTADIYIRNVSVEKIG